MNEIKNENKTVETVEAKVGEYTPFYEVKMQGKLFDFEMKEDGSTQLLFEETIQIDVNGTLLPKLVQHSVRLRASKPLMKPELESLMGTTIEVNNIKEIISYKKIEDGVYDFDKVESIAFVGTSYKKITEEVEGNFKLFRMFEIEKVANIAPETEYDFKKKKTSIKKDVCLVQYYVKNGNKRSLHNIRVNGLDYKNGLELLGKKAKVLDYKDGKTPTCTRIEKI
jgi:hypothetical protein